MSWNQRSSACMGFAFFRGSIPPRPEEFSFLVSHDIQIHPADPENASLWELHLEHPEWGRARMWAPRISQTLPEVLTKYDPRLDDSEKRDASLARSSVVIKVDGIKGDVLRDRKRLLRFLYAVLGDDGLIACDVTAMRFWPRSALV